MYKIQNLVDEGQKPPYTAENESIYGALDAAWQLYRMTEQDVEIIELTSYNEVTGLMDGPPRRCATLKVEYVDE